MAKHAYRDDLGDKFSEGARRLWEELDRRYEGNQAALAAALDVDGSAVHRWLHGDQRPGVAMTLKIQERFRIGARLWREPPSVPFVLPGNRPDPDDKGIRHTEAKAV